MQTRVILEADVLEDKKQNLLNYLKEILPDTRLYKGCNDISIFEESDSNSLTFISNWDTKQDYDNYLTWRTKTGVLRKLSQFLKSPPKIRFLNKAL